MKKQKKVLIVGHLAEGRQLLNGQTIKTQIIKEQIIKKYGMDNLEYIDTFEFSKYFLSILKNLVKYYFECENIIIMPGRNGIKLFVPILNSLSLIAKKNMIYIVVGGWLPDFLENHSLLRKLLKQFNCIFVETEGIKKKLYGFKNVSVMANCKELDIVSNETKDWIGSVKFCTFSRVMKEKGIEYAVEAVGELNSEGVECTLDIYGQIDALQKTWFEDLSKTFPDYINYCGMIPFDKTTEVLKNYYALLFPTYYEGEGFAGTLIDAMAGGIPVVSSDWKYNSEIVTDGVTGLLCKVNSVKDLKNKMFEMIDQKEKWMENRSEIIKAAYNYLPEQVLTVLYEQMV